MSMFGQSSFGSGFGQSQQPQQTSLFGSTPQTSFTGFGQPQQQTGAFGATSTPFGQPQQQSTSTGLLGTTPSFGQQQPSTSLFSGFGQTQTSTSSTFSGFGQPPQQQQQQPTSNTFSGFGQAPQQQSSAFSFGQTQAQPATSGFSGFGQTQQQPTSTFSGFGTQQQPTSSSSAFTGFGQSQQQPTSSFSGFGSAFGQPQQQPATSFSFPTQSTTATTAPTFNFNTGSLGTTTSQAPQIGVAQPFSFSSTKPLTTTPAFNFSTPSLGQPQQQSSSFFQPLQTQQQPLQQQSQFSFSQQQQPFQLQSLQQQQQNAAQAAQAQQAADSHAFYQSIFQCHKFGDERDVILANFNYVQAGWGRGKGHYSQTFPPVIYTPSNPFYRFKAVSYAFIQTENNEDGHVTFYMKKPEETARQEESTLITNLQNMLGKPNIFLRVSGMKRVDGNTTMVNLFAEDKTTLRRVPATDLCGALLQPQWKGHLDNLLIERLQAKIRPSPEQLKRYLEDAPLGLDPRVWRQAQEDNPDPDHMIPVAIIGIDELKKRAAQQESESHQHMIRLVLMEEEITGLQNRHTNMTAELQQLKRKELELAHRLLKVVLRQEIRRKDGTTIQPEEEELNKLLITLEEEISTPAEFRGKLNELLSRARLKVNEEGGVRYSLDDDALIRVKTFLETQQESIQSIANTVEDDMDQLKFAGASMDELALQSQNLAATRQLSPSALE